VPTSIHFYSYIYHYIITLLKQYINIHNIEAVKSHQQITTKSVEDELSDLSDDDEYILPPRSAVDKLKHLKQVPVFTTKQSIKELFSNTEKVM